MYSDYGHLFTWVDRIWIDLDTIPYLLFVLLISIWWYSYSQKHVWSGQKIEPIHICPVPIHPKYPSLFLALWSLYCVSKLGCPIDWKNFYRCQSPQGQVHINVHAITHTLILLVWPYYYYLPTDKPRTFWGLPWSETGITIINQKLLSFLKFWKRKACLTNIC